MGRLSNFQKAETYLDKYVFIIDDIYFEHFSLHKGYKIFAVSQEEDGSIALEVYDDSGRQNGVYFDDMNISYIVVENVNFSKVLYE